MPLFHTPPIRPLVAPSMLAADFARAGDEARAAIDAGADLLHLDIMDGHFVPNLTMGPDMCRALRRALPGAFLDVHLMVDDPDRFVEPFVRAGANHLTFHVEAPALESPDAHLTLARRIRSRGLSVGVALRPATEVHALQRLLAEVDLVLVMSVNPGFGGQAFIPDAADRAREIKPLLTPGQRLEMDGGLNPQNCPIAVSAGVDVLVVGTALFGRPRSEWPGLIDRYRTKN